MKLRSTKLWLMWLCLDYVVAERCGHGSRPRVAEACRARVLYKELELYERYSPCHPSCHHLWSEHIEVEDMDMLEVEGMNMVDEHFYLMNHRPEVEGMNTVKVP
jgi:hypothetical protein